MLYNIRNGVIRWQIPHFLSDGNSNVYIFPALLVKITTFKEFDLDLRSRSSSTTCTMISFDGKKYERHMKVMYENVWKSMKGILDHFSLFLTVFEIFTFQNSWSWKCRSRTWRTTFAVAPFVCQIPYLMDNSNVCSTCRRLRDIRI